MSKVVRRWIVLLSPIWVIMAIYMPVFAQEKVLTNCILDEKLNDRVAYIETVIENGVAEECEDNIYSASITAKTTQTKSKTVYYKNAKGDVLWYVKVVGTFSYGNGSAKCTKATVVAESYRKAWKISNKSASKTGNKARATATGKRYFNGVPVDSITKTVTLKCSPTGEFS